MKRILALFALLTLSSISVFAQKTEEGMASFYADKFNGKKTANGETYHHAKKTAAHRTLPFGTIVKVTNLENQKQVIVRINDRGPFKKNRIIDLSKSAAQSLGFVSKGLTKVRIEVVGSLDDFDKPQQQIQNNPKTTSTTPTQKPKTSNLYKLSITKQNKGGFGIQLGSFNDFSSAARMIASFGEKQMPEVLLQIEQKANEEVYKVIAGPWENRFAAEDKKSQFKPAFPGCFIIEL